MLIVRYAHGGNDAPAGIGVMTDAGIHPLPVTRLADLLRSSLADIEQVVTTAERHEPIPVDSVRLLAPVDGMTEIWAAGVTYEDSRNARVEESERASNVYLSVYDSDRPELFFKAPAWRAVGDGGTIRIRADGGVSVPEPELAATVNAHSEVVGYLICNDVSSRSIEAENPLYLPQAKIYDGACAIGPGIRPVWELPDPYDVRVTTTIVRDHVVVWAGDMHTQRLRRRIPELVAWLTRETTFPEGFLLSTGTGCVPDWPFTLESRDVIAIEMSGIGTLRNTVSQ